MRNLIKNPGIRFIILFLLLFGLQYGFHEMYIGITSPGGSTYNRFLEQHLNYINWVRSSILHGANVIAHLLGYDTFINPPFKLQIGRYTVTMVYSCIGFAVMSFWIAFVIAHSARFKKKLLWTAGGVLAIWTINCLRVALLLIANYNRWNAFRIIDHHTLFNIAAYLLIFIMIYFFTKKEKSTIAPANT